MKNFIKFVGVIAIFAVSLISTVSCDLFPHSSVTNITKSRAVIDTEAGAEAKKYVMNLVVTGQADAEMVSRLAQVIGHSPNRYSWRMLKKAIISGTVQWDAERLSSDRR